MIKTKCYLFNQPPKSLPHNIGKLSLGMVTSPKGESTEWTTKLPVMAVAVFHNFGTVSCLIRKFLKFLYID